MVGIAWLSNFVLPRPGRPPWLTSAGLGVPAPLLAAEVSNVASTCEETARVKGNDGTKKQNEMKH